MTGSARGDGLGEAGGSDTAWGGSGQRGRGRSVGDGHGRRHAADERPGPVLVARAACGLVADDRRFDDHVRRAADHDQVLDVVAPDQNQLALAIEVIGIDDAEAGLTCAPVGCRAQPPAERQAVEQEDHDEQDEDSRHHGSRGQELVVLEKTGQRLHASVRLSTQAPLKC